MDLQRRKEIKVTDAPKGEIPICPYCKKQLDEIWLKKSGLGFIEQKQIVFCPKCRALLGFGVFSR